MKTVLDTTMNAYDTIVAVTQNNINGNIKALFGLDDGVHATISLKTSRMGELECSIAPPTVRLNVKNAPGKVLYQMLFKHGVLKYYANDTTDDLSSQVINGWKIAFTVDMDISDIETEALPEQVINALKRRLPNGEIDPSMFSVRQLILQFQNVVNLDSFTTSFPAEVADPNDPSKLKDPVLNGGLLNLLNTYLQQIKGRDYNFLGYALTVKNPNVLQPKTPTFPPTDLTYSVNLFRAEDGQAPDPQSTDGGLDTLNYLMMTNKRPWPTTNPSAPAWFGNWVTPPDQYGVVAIAKRLFIDEYLLPQLAKVATFHNNFVLSDPVGTVSSISYKIRPSEQKPVHGRPLLAKLSVHHGVKERLHPYIRT